MNASRPNILFLYADQHRADVLGCAGNEVVVTPSLDRLAAEGLRCTNAWAESPICQPSRASVLTAQYPTEHGVLGNFAGDCSPDWATFPKALQAAGYETATIGKTHYTAWPIGSNGPEDIPPPTDESISRFGFDHVVEEFDRYVHVGEQFTPYMRFLQEHKMLEPYRREILARFRGTEHQWDAATSPLPQDLDLTSFLAAESERWLGQRTGDKPWFLQLSFVQPHVPLMGDPVWSEHYADADIARTAPSIPQPDHKAWSDHLALVQIHSHSELLSDDYVLAAARQYYAMVSLIDQKIGELIKFLAERGDLDNTMIVYASDHGEMLGDHGLMAKMNFYKSSVTVPLIVRPPGGSAPVVYDGPVQAFDMVGSMLDAADAQLDGSSARSLLPLLDGVAAHRDIAVSMIRMLPGMPTWIAVTDGRWRVTFDRDTGDVVEVFDLASDKDETSDLSSSELDDHVVELRLRAQTELGLTPSA